MYEYGKCFRPFYIDFHTVDKSASESFDPFRPHVGENGYHRFKERQI